MTNLSRAALFLILCIAVTLLLLSGGQKEKLNAELNREIENNRIATFSDDKLITLETILLNLMNLVDGGVFSINSVEEDGLRVFTYRSDEDHNFNFGSGNAIYDSLHDIIFIDEGLIDVSMIMGSGALNDANAELRNYLVFILLHELGHRELHSGRKTLFDRLTSQNEKFQLENEADDFAVDKFKEIIRDPEQREFYDYIYQGSTFVPGLTKGDLTQSEIIYGEIAGLFWYASSVYMTGRTPFPPYHGDKTHESFAERAYRVLNREDLFVDLTPSVNSHREVILEWFSRLLSITYQDRITLKFEEPIQAIGFSEDEWVVLSSKTGLKIQSIMQDYEKNTHTHVDGHWQPLSSKTKEFINRLIHLFKDKRGIWHAARLENGDIAPLFDEDSGYSYESPGEIDGFLQVPPQPNFWLYGMSQSQLHVFDGRWESTEFDALIQTIETELQLSDVELTFLNAGEDWIGCMITKRINDEVHALGWCVVSISPIIEVTHIQLFEERIPGASNNVFFLAGYPVAPFLFVVPTKDLDEPILVRDELGKVTSSSAIALHDIPLRKTPLWFSYPPIWPGDATCCAADKLHIMYVGDSVYSIDKNGETRVVMHPATSIMPLQDGSVVLIPQMHAFSAYLILNQDLN